MMRTIFKFFVFIIIVVAVLFPILQVLYRVFYNLPIDGLLSSLPYVYLGIAIFGGLIYLLLTFTKKK